MNENAVEKLEIEKGVPSNRRGNKIATTSHSLFLGKINKAQNTGFPLETYIFLAISRKVKNTLYLVYN